ncbi:septal ring lytic transglycosylase RlpA family protein [Alloalcanivorax marinus]|uniref:septal ring lytic transglycosylase RlpA family protein n=1 Tax=Alloalcanivorax marinus TaxID=1177169 RepID=UPI001933A17B|nr:septal ring lytic transglycosylase RlpA family protein [Alloalcanivorax marinus]
MRRVAPILTLSLFLGACATGPGRAPGPAPQPDRPASGAPGSDRYEHSTDAGPEQRRDVSAQPEPVPKVEPRSAYGNPDTYTVWGKSYQVLPTAEGYQEEGLASWYGRKFHGYRTSSGEAFDMYRFTAAHRTLPLPTYARVTNLDNGKSLVVRVNDRGPFHSDRIIDLSWAAAVRLGIEQKGTGRVRVEALTSTRDPTPNKSDGRVPTAVRAAVDSPPPPSSADSAADNGSNGGSNAGGDLYLQAGAFQGLDGARALEQRLRQQLKLPVTVRRPESSSLYKVWLGPFASNADRDRARRSLAEAGFAAPISVNP